MLIPRSVARSILIGALICGMSLHSQLSTGTISGEVKDPSGAVVAGAEWELLDGQSRNPGDQAPADASGFFIVPAVPAGTYTLTVETSGFKS